MAATPPHHTTRQAHSPVSMIPGAAKRQAPLVQGWQQWQGWWAVLAGVLLLLAGCGTPGGEACGGAGDFVACLAITSIQPININEEPTSNVDAVRDVCDVDEETGELELEPFGDHNATITFANTTFPGASAGLAITIENFAVSYTLNDCPAQATGCPPLTGFTVSPGQTLVVPADGSVEATFPFVPLRVKDEYVAKGGELFSSFLPSYTANYVFTARTDLFQESIRIEGAAEFTIGNFDNCP
ncbi:MAG: hypothetical protein KatS3mg131_1868 [Candidatus Tectimicrobiota bacterium]|nr:MAG: hypothetical protein KatS3mg131_1868 [Candidatus Tectomicrobia bacterium]